jgi:translation initiation factor 1A
MPKNMGKGGKSYKSGKKAGDTAGGGQKKELTEKDGTDQMYGCVTRMLGNGYVEVNCEDSKKHRARIPGALRRKVWICVGDMILVSSREFEGADCTVDVLHKYNADETKALIKQHPDLSVLMASDRTAGGGSVQFVVDQDDDDEDGDDERVATVNPQRQAQGLGSSDDDDDEDGLDIDKI